MPPRREKPPDRSPSAAKRTIPDRRTSSSFRKPLRTRRQGNENQTNIQIRSRPKQRRFRTHDPDRPAGRFRDPRSPAPASGPARGRGKIDRPHFCRQMQFKGRFMTRKKQSCTIFVIGSTRNPKIERSGAKHFRPEPQSRRNRHPQEKTEQAWQP